MLWLVDENFNHRIVRGVRRRLPTVDIAIAQDVGLSGVDDPALLEWAALNQRVVLSPDVRTLAGYAYDRVNRKLPMPGVFEASPSIPIGVAIDDIILLTECSLEGEWEGQVRYLPLR